MNENLNERRELFFAHLAAGIDVPTAAAASDYWLEDPEPDARYVDTADEDQRRPKPADGSVLWLGVVIAAVIWWCL